MSNECGNENACELKEQLLDGPRGMVNANQVFEIAYKIINKETLLEIPGRCKIIDKIVEAAEQGLFEVTIEENAYELNYKPFKRYLEDNGYEVYVVKGSKNRHGDWSKTIGFINWDKERI